jgi:DNA helicase-2/ATP-dependent DNA helicase PcrA
MDPSPQALSEAELAIVAEEEALLHRVQARLRELSRKNVGFGDAEARIEELRDEATSAHEEDLPALLDQLHVVRTVHEARRLRTLPDRTSPYFAHFRLRQANEARDYLLGYVQLLDTVAGIRILDWRNAPLSQLYYRYREGEVVEEDLPGRSLEGVVELRRSVTVVDGKLRAIGLPGGRLEWRDGRWHRVDESRLPALGGGSGSAQRGALGTGAGHAGRVKLDVSALLDPTQFEIVTANGSDPLLVLGSAGSGKTTVALHRLAALQDADPERFGSKRLLFVGPEPGLARLASRLLAPLGLGEVECLMYSDWCKREATRLMPDLPRSVSDEAPTSVARLKRHRSLMEHLPAWLSGRAKARKPEALRQELLTDRALLARVVEAAHGELHPAVIEEVVQRTLRQASLPAEKAYRHVDADRLVALDSRALDAGTPDEIARTLDVEDLPILLEIWRLNRGDGVRRRAHLVIDEAQEFSGLELRSMRQALGEKPSLTVAGDDLQKTGTGPEFQGWDLPLADLRIPDAARRALSISYRCPLPIAQVANRILGSLAHTPLPQTGRPGAPVGWYRFPNFGAETLFLQDAIGDLVAREPRASVGLLTRSPGSAQRWAEALDHLPEVRLVRGGSFTFEPGLDVCEVAEAKGLEFDYVIVPDADSVCYPDSNDSRRMLHVAATRAMHQLWLCFVGSPSAILPEAPEEGSVAG